jgi:hypothetical protein
MCILVVGVFLEDIVEFKHALVVQLLERVTVPDRDSRYVLGNIPRRRLIVNGYIVGDIGRFWCFWG